jgi:hypothetical protein
LAKFFCGVGLSSKVDKKSKDEKPKFESGAKTGKSGKSVADSTGQSRLKLWLESHGTEAGVSVGLGLAAYLVGYFRFRCPPFSTHFYHPCRKKF